MNREILTIGILVLLSGCTVMPRTSSELVNTSSTVEKYCYMEKADVIQERINKFLYQCYKTNLIPKKEIIEGGSRISLGNAIGVGFSVEILGETPACRTNVTMYGVSFFWKVTFNMVDSVAKGKEIKCARSI